MMDTYRILIEGMASILLILATFFLYRVSAKLEKLTDALFSLREELAKDYVRLEEFIRMRDRIHEILNMISEIKAKLYFNEHRDKS